MTSDWSAVPANIQGNHDMQIKLVLKKANAFQCVCYMRGNASIRNGPKITTNTTDCLRLSASFSIS